MDAVLIALAFIIIGVLLLIAEAVTPGSFIMVPGTTLIILGIIWMIYPDWINQWWSPILIVIIVIPMIFASIKLYQMLAPPAPPETTVGSSLIGKTGVVTVEVVPDKITGKVRIDNDNWSATSYKRIPVGTSIVVVESTGVHVRVDEIKKQTQ